MDSSRIGARAETPEPRLGLVPASPLHGGHRGTSVTCKTPSEPSGAMPPGRCQTGPPRPFCSHRRRQRGAGLGAGGCEHPGHHELRSPAKLQPLWEVRTERSLLQHPAEPPPSRSCRPHLSSHVTAPKRASHQGFALGQQTPSCLQALALQEGHWGRIQHLHRGDEVPLQGRHIASRGNGRSGVAAAGGGRSTLTAPGHSRDSAGRKELQLLALTGERGSIAARRPRAGGRRRDRGSGHREGAVSLHPGVLRWVVPPPAPGFSSPGERLSSRLLPTLLLLSALSGTLSMQLPAP